MSDDAQDRTLDKSKATAWHLHVTLRDLVRELLLEAVCPLCQRPRDHHDGDCQLMQAWKVVKETSPNVGYKPVLRTCPACGAWAAETTTMGRDLVTGADPNIVTCEIGHRYPADPMHPRWQTDETDERGLVIEGPRPGGLVNPRGTR